MHRQQKAAWNEPREPPFFVGAQHVPKTAVVCLYLLRLLSESNENRPVTPEPTLRLSRLPSERILFLQAGPVRLLSLALKLRWPRSRADVSDTTKRCESQYTTLRCTSKSKGDAR